MLDERGRVTEALKMYEEIVTTTCVWEDPCVEMVML
jgi:hypothetical protein